jgi:hypothetical protein
MARSGIHEPVAGEGTTGFGIHEPAAAMEEESTASERPGRRVGEGGRGREGGRTPVREGGGRTGAPPSAVVGAWRGARAPGGLGARLVCRCWLLERRERTMRERGARGRRGGI